ncbi:MAG TPA: YihY/virulence factor BrkB family protein [Solirubrobacteraceae bacterium]|nr:YihY/virulence factor BrkB family protein [Solirubrobacteraceae bacterium]
MRAQVRRRDFLARLLRRALAEFSRDRCAQHAAAIAYHVLFSLFPLAIVLTGAGNLVLHATGSRARIVDTIVSNLPLSPDGAAHLRDLLLGATSTTASLGLIAILGLIYSASGMMTALRTALNQAWDVEQPRPFLKGKLIDLGLVFGVATVGLASLALTIAARFLSAHTPLSGAAAWAASVLVPLIVAFAVTLLLYRIVPAADVRLRDAWPAALLVAVMLVLLENLFAVYVANFAHYNAVYGSLGAVIAFMFFVYLAAQLLLLGAEIASEWPRVDRALHPGQTPPDGRSLGSRVKEALRRLWVPRDGRAGQGDDSDRSP